VRLDVPGRRIDLLVDDAELARRRATLPARPRPERGWRRLYADSVTQAHEGADLGFMAARPQARDDG
jgi:dihydroxy-acid dehydratase